MIGKRLKLARSAAGLSLRALARDMGGRVTAQAIGKYERNESMPSLGVVEALSGSLGVPIDYLMSSRELVVEELRFRKRASLSSRERHRVEAKMLSRLDRYLTVEEILGLPSLEWDAPRAAPYPVRNGTSDPERAANSLRAHWRLGSSAVPNLAELLEERGVKVLSLDLGNINGLVASVRVGGTDPTPVIAVNRLNSGDRQRFTMAHELGHAVLQIRSNADAESAAHRFAEAFLLPAEPLWAELGKFRESICIAEMLHIKERFGASLQAITYRCSHLGIFGKSLTEALFCLFRERGWSAPPYEEPNPVPREAPRRFERLCYRALAEGAIGDSKAAELFDMALYDLDRRLSEDPSLTQVDGLQG